MELTLLKCTGKELIKFPVLTARHLCGVLLRKNGNLGELEDRRCISYLVEYWVCQRFVTARRLRVERTMGSNWVNSCQAGLELPSNKTPHRSLIYNE